MSVPDQVGMNTVEEFKHLYIHVYSTYTTTITTWAPLSVVMQLCQLTDKQGSPPFAHHYWSHPLHTHTVEAQQADQQGSPPLLHCMMAKYTFEHT